MASNEPVPVFHSRSDCTSNPSHAFQNADNPNLVGIVMAVSDMEVFNAFMSSDAAAVAAAADGVDLEATTFLNEVR